MEETTPSVPKPTFDEEKVVNILYTNYKGETAIRKIVPLKIWFGFTDWHPETQWLMDALDIEKGVERSFALKDIRSWFVE